MNTRLKQLDILRFLALFLVLGRHMTPCPVETSVAVSIFTGLWKTGGWVGVDLFFVLSGFLVSGLIFREYEKTGKADLKRFLIRRGFKIYPGFWVYLAFTVTVLLITGVPIIRENLMGEVLFLQNYLGALSGHTWSLAVEEHFYILLALLFALLIYRSPDKPFVDIPKIFVIIGGACFALRLVVSKNVYYSPETHLYPTHLRIDSLFFGVLISYLWTFKGLGKNEFLRRYKNYIGWAGVLLFLPAFTFELEKTQMMIPIGLTVFYLAGGCLLLALLLTELKPRVVWSVIAFIGRYSYSIYLWHFAISNWFTDAYKNGSFFGNWFLYSAAYLTASIIIGILMGALIEYPFLKLRDRFYPPRSAGVLRTSMVAA